MFEIAILLIFNVILLVFLGVQLGDRCHKMKAKNMPDLPSSILRS